MGLRAGAFIAGWLLLGAALAPPTERAAEQSFVWHMVQHVVLIGAAAPLLAAAISPALLPGRLPLRGRRQLARLHLRARRFLPSLGSFAIAAAVVHALVVWAWHVPRAFEAALGSPVLHAIEHATLFGSALVLWWALLGFGARVRPGVQVIAAAFFTAAQGAALGALLTFSPEPWYSAYASGTAAAAVSDQQIAGLVMWAGGSVGPVLLASWLIITWIRRLDRYPRAVG